MHDLKTFPFEYKSSCGNGADPSISFGFISERGHPLDSSATKL